MFKKGIRPEWEDPQNKQGSEWASSRKMMSADVLDQHWENMVLALIGETIDESNEICGCRVVDKSKVGKGAAGRPVFRLELWLQSKQDDVAGRIKNRLLDALTDGEFSKGTAKKSLVPDFEFRVHHGV